MHTVGQLQYISSSRATQANLMMCTHMRTCVVLVLQLLQLRQQHLF